jgi:hypothetical protein
MSTLSYLYHTDRICSLKIGWLEKARKTVRHPVVAHGRTWPRVLSVMTVMNFIFFGLIGEFPHCGF